MRAAAGVFAAILSVSNTPSHAVHLRANMNPIRKVVTMLQKMQVKVEQEGEKEKELYEKFMCYCKNGKGDLAQSISIAEGKVEAVGASIEEGAAKLQQAKQDLSKAQTNRKAAEQAMAEATSLREKEAKEFASMKADMDADIAAMGKAVAALEGGMSGAFLQSSDARVLRELVGKVRDFDATARDTVVAFLAGSSSDEYAPQSGEITGILKQMKDTMEKDLAEATATENEAVANYKALMGAKTKEVGALSANIESKTTLIGELGVNNVAMADDLSDTQKALEADKKFIAELETSCKTKTAEWDERSKTRAEELVALGDTIKVLNDDEALDLFKSTLPAPGASFVQVVDSSVSVQSQTREIVANARTSANKSDKAGLSLLLLALGRSGSRGNFDKVIKMVDDMVDVLKKEQVDDDNKKEYCNAQLDKTDDERKALERSISLQENAIATAKDSIETLTKDMSDLAAGIKALDKAVKEATAQRQAENAEYKELMASNTAAKKLLDFAKNRLNQFYNPALYVPPPKRELSEEDQIVVNMGGAAPPTAAPGGIAGTGISVAFLQVSDSAAPAPPPETWDAYAKKGQESTGVIAMIDLLIKDLDKEMDEAKVEETDAQKDYEAMMTESTEKRRADSTLLTEKTGTKADVEAELEKHTEKKGATTKELMATMKYISSLHAECDWLLKYFGARKDARASEIESLHRAKSVLSGASYSFVQRAAQRMLTVGA